MNKYEIHYRYAAKKITVHLQVIGDDMLIKQLTRLKDEGVEIIGVSNITDPPPIPIVGPGGLE